MKICVELLKVLLHKSNTYSLEHFNDLRMNAMVAVTVHYPRESAEYLTSQFYEAGYTITQRTDILHVSQITHIFGKKNDAKKNIRWISFKVLVVSIQKLSNPNEEPVFDRRVFALFELEQSNAAYLLPINQIRDEKWKEELKKRIEAKTVHKKVIRLLLKKKLIRNGIEFSNWKAVKTSRQNGKIKREQVLAGLRLLFLSFTQSVRQVSQAINSIRLIIVTKRVSILTKKSGSL